MQFQNQNQMFANNKNINGGISINNSNINGGANQNPNMVVLK